MTRCRETDVRLDVIGFAVIFTMIGRTVVFLGRISFLPMIPLVTFIPLVATAVALTAAMTISVTIPRIRHDRRSEQSE